MASHNRLNKCVLFDAQALTGTNSYTSKVVNIQFLDNVGVQMNFTGTMTGSFVVEVSSDHAQDAQGVVTTEGQWVPVPISQSTDPGGSAIDMFVDLNQLSATYARVTYTNATGTGTLNGCISGKGLM